MWGGRSRGSLIRDRQLTITPRKNCQYYSSHPMAFSYGATILGVVGRLSQAAYFESSGGQQCSIGRSCS